jgi:hypothetical protein
VITRSSGLLCFPIPFRSCTEISATVPASGTCCAHLSVFDRGFTIDPVDGFATHRRQSPGEASALAIEVVARIRWNLTLSGRACSAASTTAPARCKENTDHSRVADQTKGIFGQRHSTLQQPRAISSGGTVARPRIGRFSTPRSGDPHRQETRIYGASHQYQRILTRSNVPEIGAS